jgi:hypothetical protein
VASDNKTHWMTLGQALIGCAGMLVAALISGAFGLTQVIISRLQATPVPSPTAMSSPLPTEQVVLPPIQGGCPPLPVFILKRSGLIRSVILAQSVTEPEKEPVNATSDFSPNSVIHAVVALNNAPINTKLTAAWYITDAGISARCNTGIDSVNVEVMGDRNEEFALMPKEPFQPGYYRVEIYVNDNLEKVIPFTVSQPAKQSPTLKRQMFPKVRVFPPRLR